MILKPLSHRRSGTIRQECHGLPVLQVHQDRARGVPLPQGKIVDPEHPGWGGRLRRRPAQAAQERSPAHPQVPGVTALRPGLAPEGHAERHQALGQP